MEEENVKKMVRQAYGKIAKAKKCCCGSETEKGIGYTEKELESVPGWEDYSLGCGNPIALASLREGETVLDLGSGAGLDCFLAANSVGEKGKVIGVDMTPEMIDKARENCRKSKHNNVEFRLGEIENLPVADSTVDVIISNCVINLSPNKKRVFDEAFRVLRPGGRLMISDIVLLKELPEAVKENVQAYIGCVAGAVMKTEYVGLIEEAGFQGVKIVKEAHFPVEVAADDPLVKTITKDLEMPVESIKEFVGSIVSIAVCATKPKE